MNIEIARCKENIQNYGGLVVLDKFSAQLPTFNQNFLVENNNNQNRITDGQVLKAAHHLQCLGLTNYQDIEEMNSNTLFTNLIGRSVSCETYRQRLDELGKNPAVLQSIDAAIALQLRSAHLTTVPFMGQIFTPMDVDVTPLLNPKCHKEGISCTYKKVDGFAPLNSYLGAHALVFELRKVSQL